MVNAPAKVTKRGRVTIPADVRRELELQEGDYVMIDVEPIE